MLRQLLRRCYPLREQKGISVAETLVSLALLGVIGVSFLSAISTGFMTTEPLDEQIQAESLARNQLEQLKDTTYDDTMPIDYPVTVDLPPGYSLSILAHKIDGSNTIQQITVKVYRDGDILFQLTDFKANR